MVRYVNVTEWFTTYSMKRKKALFLLPFILLTFMNTSISAQTLPENKASLEQKLAEYTWKKRVLLVFSPSQTDRSYQQQQEIVKSATNDMPERDLVFLPLLYKQLSAEDLQYAHTSFDINGDTFQVILIGKDGGAKINSTEPVSAEELFRIIDAMPMRQQEMRRNN